MTTKKDDNNKDVIDAIAYTVPEGKTLTTNDYFELDTNGKNVKAKTGVDNSKLAEAGFKTWAESFGVSLGTKTATADGSLEFDKLTDGYYYITTTTGSLVTVTSIKPNQEVTDKNTLPTNGKTQSKTSNGTYNTDELSQEIGKEVYYQVTVDIPKSADKEIKVVDTMSKGLTLNNTDTAVTYSAKVGETTKSLDSVTGLPTVWTADDTNPDTDGNNKYSITLTADQVKALAALADDSTALTLTLSYSAKVNKDAVVGGAGNTNKAHIEYSNTSTADVSVITKTYQFEVHKYANDDKTGHLKNAVFQLKTSDDTVVNLMKVSDTEYRVADATETSTVSSHVKDGELQTVTASSDNPPKVSDFITVSSENITIKGVDADTTYKLVEIKAPDGYNLLTDATNVTVNKNSATTIEIQNKSGSTLPSTGGIGTTIFYVAGSILIIGAAALLISRRKRQA